MSQFGVFFGTKSDADPEIFSSGGIRRVSKLVFLESPPRKREIIGCQFGPQPFFKSERINILLT